MNEDRPILSAAKCRPIIDIRFTFYKKRHFRIYLNAGIVTKQNQKILNLAIRSRGLRRRI